MEQKINLSKVLPLTETTLFTLLATLHGKQGEFALKYIEENTHKHVKLTLEQYYDLLKKMRNKHLVVQINSEHKENKNPIFVITPLGQEVILLELKRLKSVIDKLNTSIKEIEAFNEQSKTSH